MDKEEIGKKLAELLQWKEEQRERGAQSDLKVDVFEVAQWVGVYDEFYKSYHNIKI
jgi:hypothetical protein